MSNVDEVTSLLEKESKQDGADFTEYDLNGASINGASFIYATFDKAQLENAELTGINFSQASLKGGSLKNSTLTDIDFTGAKLALRTESEVTLIKTIRIGIMGIFEKSNPAKIQKNMNALLAPEERKD